MSLEHALPPAQNNGAVRMVLDYQSLFEVMPGPLAVVTPDDPRFTMVAVNDAYVRAAQKSREELVGRGIFEVFPEGPNSAHAATIGNLRASFRRVIATAQQDTMPVQRYDLPRPEVEGGGMEERYWSPLNSPVLSPDGTVQFLIHRPEEVTEVVCLKRREAEQDQLAATERLRADRIEAELSLHRQELIQEKLISDERQRTALALSASEDKFRLMANSVPQIVWITDAEGRTEFFNRQWSEYTGVPYEPTTAAKIAAWFVHPDDGPQTISAFEQAQHTGAPFTVEHRIRSREGTYRWFLVRAVPYRDPGTGEVVRWFGSSTDINDRKLAEAALRESEARLAACFESLPIAVGIVDTTGALILSNREMERFWPTAAISSNDESRSSRWRGHHADGRPIERHDFPGVRALRGERVLPGLEMLYTQDDGTDIWTSISAVPIRDAEGQVVGQVSVVSDIDALRRTAEALRASEAKQAFLLTLSDAIRSLRDPEAIKVAACRVLGEQLRANRAFYAEIEGDDWIVEGGYGQENVLLPSGRYAASTYGAQIMETYRSGKQVVLRDLRTDPDFTPEQRDAHLAINILGSLGVPLMEDGKLVAILAVDTAEPRNWTEDEIAVVEETAERTWAAVERARAETALSQSEEKYRSLFESIDEGFCIIEVLFDRDGTAHDYRFLEVNPAFEHQTGIIGAMGRTVRDFVPQQESHWFEIYGQVALTGQPVRFENQAAGLRRVFDVYAFRAPGAKQHQVALLFRDVTKQKLAEAALRESEERFRQLTESLPQLVWSCLSDGRCDYLSKQWIAYTGVSEAEQLDLRWLERVIHPEDRERTLEHWLGAVAGHHPYDIDYRIRAADGNYRWFQTRGAPLRDGQGAIAKWFGTCTDIDDLKRAEEALHKANRELEEFAYVASHDMQEPLRMVNVYTQLLIRRYAGTEPQAQQYAAIIHKGVNRMETLIHDLLAFSRTIHSDHLDSSKADLSAALTEATSVLKSRIDETGALINAPLLPVVSGDTAQFAQVFQNLLSNALKYQSNGTRPEIQISVSREGTNWVIAIRDNGIGFEPQYAKRIFGLFKRLHKDEFPGTGLGLAICQRIIERRGGRIWAESRPGDGSTFLFSLPNLEAE